MTNAHETTDRYRYGAVETNGLVNPDEYFAIERENVWLHDKRLARITRLRLISDPGYPMWDVSYVHGELKDGTPVRVSFPEHQFRKGAVTAGLLAMCKRYGVYAKGLGLLDPSIRSNCH